MSGEIAPLFNSMTQKMHWLTDRQQVLADNIANADTPGFRPSDLTSFSDHMTSLSAPLKMATTNANHISFNGGSAANSAVKSPSIVTAKTDNGVVVEDQIKKSTETVMDYNLISNLYKKQMGFLKLAAGSR